MRAVSGKLQEQVPDGSKSESWREDVKRGRKENWKVGD